MTRQQERERRKAIKRKLDVRQYDPFPVFRSNRGPAYLTAHACFRCRCSFKLKWTYSDQREAPCPNCRRPLAWMGRRFRAPKRSDIRQWKKVEALWNAGIRFSICNGPDRMPETLGEVQPFLKRLNQRNIERFRTRMR